MNVMVVENYEQLSQKSAQHFYNRIVNRSNYNLGLATGGTPIGFYRELVKLLKGDSSVNKLKTFNLDEYIGLSQDDPNSFYSFMNKHFFNPLNLSHEQTFIPDGHAQHLDEECRMYENVIKDNGGIDLQLLGVGENGHIGFNEPGSAFDDRTRVVKLKPSTIQANARFFNSVEEVPTKAITMGIGTILDAKEIVLIASGKNKADALFQLVHGEKSKNWPITALKDHPAVTVMIDQEAASRLDLTSNNKMNKV